MALALIRQIEDPEGTYSALAILSKAEDVHSFGGHSALVFDKGLTPVTDRPCILEREEDGALFIKGRGEVVKRCPISARPSDLWSELHNVYVARDGPERILGTLGCFIQKLHGGVTSLLPVLKSSLESLKFRMYKTIMSNRKESLNFLAIKNAWERNSVAEGNEQENNDKFIKEIRNIMQN